MTGCCRRIPGLRQITGAPRVVREDVRGPASHVQAEVTYLTPPGYGDPANAGKRYPVVMFLPGYPGTPSTWINKLGLQDVMDAEIAAGRVQPFMAVLPKMNIDGTRDLECSDVTGGPAAGTWLGVDVPRIVQSQVRALPPGPDWAVAGYSTGGFCSGKLTLQYPQTFGSAAVLSGYFSPDTAAGAASLFGGDTQKLHANDPMWLVRHGTRPRCGCSSSTRPRIPAPPSRPPRSSPPRGRRCASTRSGCRRAATTRASGRACCPRSCAGSGPRSSP